MAESQNNGKILKCEASTSGNQTRENIENDLRMIQAEVLICSICECHLATKYEFLQHIQEHANQTNDGSSNYMSYIEKYICTCCGKGFEVKSDLNIHYNTVCLDGPTTCKHCRKNCENIHFLEMHLVSQHKYNEEMIRDEFSSNLNDNLLLVQESNLYTFNDDNSSFATAPCNNYWSWLESRSAQQDLAFNLLDKEYICQLCNRSFSRRCVLNIHVQSHFQKLRKQEKTTRSSTSYYTPVGKAKCASKTTSLLISSACMKARPKRLNSAKWRVSSRRGRPKNIKGHASEAENNHSKSLNIKMQKPPIILGDWKKIKLSSKLRKKSDTKNDMQAKTMPKKKNRDKISKPHRSTKYEEQVYICGLCRKEFKDSYKLKRHFLTHTGERPYSCDKCNKTFARDDHLKRHIKKVCSKIDKANVNK